MTRVSYLQTGGFAGLKMAAVVDTDGLADDEAQALDAKVDAALAESAERRPERRAEPSPMRDDQQYQVTVQRGGDTTVLRAADPDVPPALAALVDDLRERAEPTR